MSETFQNPQGRAFHQKQAWWEKLKGKHIYEVSVSLVIPTKFVISSDKRKTRKEISTKIQVPDVFMQTAQHNA